jgi:glycosyltransferase 2 family protein
MSESNHLQSPSPSPTGKKINWGLLAKIILTGVILYIIFGKMDWSKFALELKGADPSWILRAFLCMGLGIILGAFRWNQLLRVQEVFLSYTKTTIYTLIGVFFSQFLPASTGGDVIKAYYLLRDAPKRKARATLSIVIDRVIGLLAVLILTLALVPFEYQRISEHAETRLFILILALLLVCILIGMLLLWIVPPSLLPAFFKKLWQKIPKRDVLFSLYEGFQAHRLAKRATFQALLLSMFAAVPVLSTGYFISQSLGLDTGYAQMTIICSLVICSISLPISFGGHGVREGVFILLFQIFNVSRDGLPVSAETATACSIIYLGISMVWSLLGGLVYLLYSHQLKQTP